MLDFKHLLFEKYDALDEKAIVVGPRAYPKFGTVVILAGGAGSGKGFVLGNLIAVEGMVFDVDALKGLALGSQKLAARVKEKTGTDLKNLSLKNPDNVRLVHELLNSKEFDVIKGNKRNRFAAIASAHPDRKPNLIFDVTLKDIKKLQTISSEVEALGYAKENIHLVWVMNDYKVASKQNQSRDRVVPEDILMDTHAGASKTMKDILSMSSGIKKYLNGDIWIAFNKVGSDSSLAKSGQGGQYITDANYVRVKARGKGIEKFSNMEKSMLRRVHNYSPDKDSWTPVVK